MNPPPIPPGAIVILNGAPRVGKSSIASALQTRSDEIWLNLGVDLWGDVVPPRLLPGLGLRPGGERPDIERYLPTLFAGLYEAVAAQSRLGFSVVVDVGHHDAYSRSLGTFREGMRSLIGLPVLLVGLHCALEVIVDRRARSAAGREGFYETVDREGRITPAVIAWQREVHRPGIYDLELDTEVFSAEQCADMIVAAIREGSARYGAIDRIVAGQ